MSYEPGRIESRWQEAWARDGVYRVPDSRETAGYYCLEMLPYPSGRLHMGHVRNYSIGDVVARYRRMQGHVVMHPMGWDSFGLPAENAAIERDVHPARWTEDNIEVMRSQLEKLGFAYDWSREIASHRPEFYRWNQWFFLRLLERDLAYRKEARVNWCPSCETVLANEQVERGLCWRCDSEVEEKRLSQWFFRTTEYADELLAGLDELPEWPDRVRTMQRHWIGRSEGARVEFTVEETGRAIDVFTTRIDTIYGATFVVLAPEQPLVEQLRKRGPGPASELDADGFREELERLRASQRRLRRGEEIDKVGLFTGHMARNPFNSESVPVWIGNFVLMEFGTGAVMAVPAHDQRDFEFARQYGLEVRPVVRPEGEEPDWVEDPSVMDEAWVEDGVLLPSSGSYEGLGSEEARERMTVAAAAGQFGEATVDYRLKDWGVSRQRYWGTPIPVVYCDQCGTVPVPEERLPVELPEDVELTGEGRSPLARSDEFVQTECPRCTGPARRETDTMDTFVDSSWYYLRYLSPHLDDAPFDPEEARHWMPVDLYIGGITHAVLHLLYFRFFCKFLADLDLLEVREPTRRLLTQGMVLKDGSAMSKSKGNVVDPNEMVAEYGADATRIFVLFAAPPRRDFEWEEGGIEGCARFLNRAWTLVDHAATELEGVGTSPGDGVEGLPDLLVKLRRKAHDTTRKVSEEIDERLHFNTAIAALMELLNECYAATNSLAVAEAGDHRWAYRDAFERLVLLLAPFAPHLAEELWRMLGHDGYVAGASWPQYDPGVLERERVSLAVQVDGKLRGSIEVPADLNDEDDLVAAARAEANVARHLEDRRIVRVVVVPGRIINLIVGD